MFKLAAVNSPWTLLTAMRVAHMSVKPLVVSTWAASLAGVQQVAYDLQALQPNNTLSHAIYKQD